MGALEALAAAFASALGGLGLAPPDEGALSAPFPASVPSPDPLDEHAAAARVTNKEPTTTNRACMIHLFRTLLMKR
jgi:hypothetical protein